MTKVPAKPARKAAAKAAAKPAAKPKRARPKKSWVDDFMRRRDELHKMLKDEGITLA